VPLALFGHDLGGRVAYEVATRLVARGVPVERLFVSGCPAPETGVLSRVHELEDAELIAALRTVGGALPMLLDDPELHEYLLPTVRADYRLLELYRPRTAPALRTGVVAFSGRDDQVVGSGAVEAWRLVTDGAFRHRMFPGGNFHLIDHATALISAVLETLAWEPTLF
jgi:pyochelin biosynthesis protein PchC